VLGIDKPPIVDLELILNHPETKDKNGSNSNKLTPTATGARTRTRTSLQLQDQFYNHKNIQRHNHVLVDGSNLITITMSIIHD
jgi:hypothetical protein